MSAWSRFKPLTDTVTHRLIWRSYGPEKSGKNHFGLTAPGPIAIQSFDIGLEGVAEKFVATGKDVRVCEYEFERNACSQADAAVICDQFVADFDAALQHARTIVWDTETELWEMFRFAEFGENPQGVSTTAPRNYVKLNARYRDLIQLAYDTGVNLQLIQKVKERWTENAKGSPVPSGVFEPTGFKEIGYLVQANLRHAWTKEHGFTIDVMNCRQNMGIAGETYEGFGFPELARAIFPDTTEADWA
jgi:hypothetical protein